MIFSPYCSARKRATDCFVLRRLYLTTMTYNGILANCAEVVKYISKNNTLRRLLLGRNADDFVSLLKNIRFKPKIFTSALEKLRKF